jgi:hypothetical protein
MVEVDCAVPGYAGLSDTTKWSVSDSMLTRSLSSVRDLVSVSKSLSNSPLVSVVMTTYNSAEFVSEAIGSILDQSYWNIELVVVDDMSSDETVSIVESFMLADSRVKLIRYGRNRGTYFSKNIGILFAKGELVTFMDSDDTCSPERIGYQVNDLRRPGVLVSTVGYSRHFADGRVVNQRRHAYISQMFRRSLCDSLGFFDSVRTSADDEFLRRVISVFGSASHYFNKEVLYHAKVRDDSLSHHPSNPKFSEETGGLSPPRREYIDNVAGWHSALAEASRAPFMDFPLMRRPFQVDVKLQVLRDAQAEFSRTAILLHEIGHPDVTDQDELLMWFDRVIVVGHPSPVERPGVVHMPRSSNNISDLMIGPILPGVVMVLKSSYSYFPDYFRISTLILSVIGGGIRVGACVPGIDPSESERASILLGTTSFVISGECTNLKMASLKELPVLSLGRLTGHVIIPFEDVASAEDGIKATMEQLAVDISDNRHLSFLSDEIIERTPVSGACRSSNLKDPMVPKVIQGIAERSSPSVPVSNLVNIRKAFGEVNVVFSGISYIFNGFEKACLVIGCAVALSLFVAVFKAFGLFFGFVSFFAFMYFSGLGVFVARRTRLSVSAGSASAGPSVRGMWQNFVRRVINFERK